MGGGFPNGNCECTTPTSATASGGTMSVQPTSRPTRRAAAAVPAPAAHRVHGRPITGYQGLCVDDRGANSANFTPVQVYTCNGTNAQQWTVVQAGSTLQALGRCLDVNGAGTADGTTVDLYTCNGTGAQVWEPQSNGELFNPSPTSASTTPPPAVPGTQLQIWDCADTANQQWHLP